LVYSCRRRTPKPKDALRRWSKRQEMRRTCDKSREMASFAAARAAKRRYTPALMHLAGVPEDTAVGGSGEGSGGGGGSGGGRRPAHPGRRTSAGARVRASRGASASCTHADSRPVSQSVSGCVRWCLYSFSVSFLNVVKPAALM